MVRSCRRSFQTNSWALTSFQELQETNLIVILLLCWTFFLLFAKFSDVIFCYIGNGRKRFYFKTFRIPLDNPIQNASWHRAHIMIYSQRSNDPDPRENIWYYTNFLSNLYLQRNMTGWHSFCMHKDVDPCFWLYSFTVLRLTCSHSLTMLSVSLQLLYGVQLTLYIQESLFNIQEQLECCCQIF